MLTSLGFLALVEVCRKLDGANAPLFPLMRLGQRAVMPRGGRSGSAAIYVPSALVTPTVCFTLSGTASRMLPGQRVLERTSTTR